VVGRTERNGVKQYTHDGQKRLNNPPVGLVTAETDHLNGKRRYQFDPHLDPELQWAGKKEGVSFDVDTVSLHVHERIDPLTIIEAVRKKEQQDQKPLFHWFETKDNNPPIRDAIEFYKHSQGWSNRLIAGDSLLVMNSLLEKEGLAGKVQMMYIDPPYGIKYGSNFQPFINKREVKDQKDEDLTQEPEMIKAFRDTWELGIHSYLSYLRDRFLLARELLSEKGSIFVQISDENMHLVRILMDEVFGKENFMNIFTYRTSAPLGSKFVPVTCDYVVWYAKDRSHVKFNRLFTSKSLADDSYYNIIELSDGSYRNLTEAESTNPDLIPNKSKPFANVTLVAAGPNEKCVFPVEYRGEKYSPTGGRGWKTTKEGMERLSKANRLYATNEVLRYKLYFDDFPYKELTNVWLDLAGASDKIYVVQTSPTVIQRCLLMTTDPGDLVFDPTCGSGTTAFVAEQWGRRWITCDTSRVAITLSKQRLMTALFDYYELAYPKEGVQAGFVYRHVPHVTLRSIANDELPEQETLYDQPVVDKFRKRVAGPFTIEAVPSQIVKGFDEVEKTSQGADASIARSGQTLKQNEWIDEMLATGIRGKSGQVLEFARIELMGGTRWLHAEAETKDCQRAVISFGPEYAPLEQRQVELAIEETQQIVPKPRLVIFASFQFDPEAAKDIDELKWPGVDVLKAQINTDLLTSDLKKKRASNESFWLIGQPDVEVRKQGNKYAVMVNGFDYYNTKTGQIESGDASRIAIWELDTDYDGRSLYPRQVFFPMAGDNEGWSKLARNLGTQIDENLIENYRGNTSLPFSLGNSKQIAVKIIDDRGIESLKIIRVKE